MRNYTLALVCAFTILFSDTACAGFMLAPAGLSEAPKIPELAPNNNPDELSSVLAKLPELALDAKRSKAVSLQEYKSLIHNLPEITAWLEHNNQAVSNCDSSLILSYARFYNGIILILEKLKSGRLMPHQKNPPYPIADYIIKRISRFPRYQGFLKLLKKQNFTASYARGGCSETEFIERLLTHYLANRALGVANIHTKKNNFKPCSLNKFWELPNIVFFDEAWIIEYYIKELLARLFSENSMPARKYTTIYNAQKWKHDVSVSRVYSGEMQHLGEGIRILYPELIEQYMGSYKVSFFKYFLDYEIAHIRELFPEMRSQSRYTEQEIARNFEKLKKSGISTIIRNYDTFLILTYSLTDSRYMRHILRDTLPFELSLDCRMRQTRTHKLRTNMLLMAAGLAKDDASETIGVSKETMSTLGAEELIKKIDKYNRLTRLLSDRTNREISGWYIPLRSSIETLFSESTKFSDRLYYCRLAAGWTQEQTVARLNSSLSHDESIEVSAYKNWERSITVPKNKHVYNAFAKIFNAKRVFGRKITAIELAYGFRPNDFFVSSYAFDPKTGDEFKLIFGKRLEAALFECGLSYTDAAMAADCNPNTISKWIKLETIGNLRQAIKILARIKRILDSLGLDTSINELLYGQRFEDLLMYEDSYAQRLKLVRFELGLEVKEMAGEAIALNSADGTKDTVHNWAKKFRNWEINRKSPKEKDGLFLYAEIYNTKNNRKLDGLLLTQQAGIMSVYDESARVMDMNKLVALMRESLAISKRKACALIPGLTENSLNFIELGDGSAKHFKNILKFYLQEFEKRGLGDEVRDMIENTQILQSLKEAENRPGNPSAERPAAVSL